MKFIFLLIPFVSFAQSPLDNWSGECAGSMILGYTTRSNDTIPVTFSMQNAIKDSVWRYTMNYKSARYGDITKDYVIRSKEKGDTVHYILDELNGLLLDESYMNDCLYGMYDVQGQIYISTLRKTEYGLFFELFGAPTGNPLVTVTDESINDEFIDASSYKPVFHQSVKLYKKQ